jgi:Uma2 family endonuclease
MNAIFPTPGLDKRRFTVADIQALVEKGVVAEDARFELLDGEIIPMSPKGPLHEDVRVVINDWVRSLPMSLVWIAETTLYLDDRSFVEPDYVFFDRGLAIADLKPGDIRLAIEVGDSSWTYDSKVKAPRYAQGGVQEYWAVNAKTRAIRVHRGPGAENWSDIRDIAPGAQVEALCAPGLPLAL